MADQLSANPWTLDLSVAVPRTVWKSKVHIHNIEFVGYSVATDSGVLQDQLGNNLWDFRGSTTFDIQRSGDLGIVNGVQLASVTNPASTGVIKIYFK